MPFSRTKALEEIAKAVTEHCAQKPAHRRPAEREQVRDMVSNVLRLPENSRPARTYLLRDEIPALQLIGTENGNSRWGPLIRLPRGAELQDFGAGFDESTLTVGFNGGFYIIFRQDIDSQRRAAWATAAGANR